MVLVNQYHNCVTRGFEPQVSGSWFDSGGMDVPF